MQSTWPNHLWLLILISFRVRDNSLWAHICFVIPICTLQLASLFALFCYIIVLSTSDHRIQSFSFCIAFWHYNTHHPTFNTLLADSIRWWVSDGGFKYNLLLWTCKSQSSGLDRSDCIWFFLVSWPPTLSGISSSQPNISSHLMIDTHYPFSFVSPFDSEDNDFRWRLFLRSFMGRSIAYNGWMDGWVIWASKMHNGLMDGWLL